ncbi:LOW QUALITY PROTEIN: UDP-glucose 4-epimerase-like [Tachypleus tridentatus]|uniref:LOW QUALITY PROTEIN: UDP-glucose 4-epimerase-like n=1 Tax=Tachypleus tridentatus TaxID=6853 RepID=UPI003FD66227
MFGTPVFVTGGAGYVGSHTILVLLNAGYEVVAIDNFVNAIPGKNGSIPESLHRVQELTGKSLTFYKMDLLDKESLKSIFSKHKFECVIHFAALKSVGESCQIPLDYYRNNIGGTINLVEVMKEFGVKNIVFSSSATVYGAPQYLPLDEKHPVGTSCTNPYGRTKYFIEEILKDVASAEKGWKVILLRYFNPVGAHESGKIGEDPQGIPNNLMPYISQVAVKRRPELQVFGNDFNTPDGTGVRDYIHVMDLAEGHVAVLKNLDAMKTCLAYNLGTGHGYTVLQVIKAFEEAAGVKIPYTVVGRRVGDLGSLYADPSLAEKELDWKAKRSLVEMCADTWRWQSQNPMGFRSETAAVQDI